MKAKHNTQMNTACFVVLQVMPSKEGLLADFQEDVAGKEEPQLRRLINESEEIAGQRCVCVYVCVERGCCVQTVGGLMCRKR